MLLDDGSDIPLFQFVVAAAAAVVAPVVVVVVQSLLKRCQQSANFYTYTQRGYCSLAIFDAPDALTTALCLHDAHTHTCTHTHTYTGSCPAQLDICQTN